MIKVGEFRQSIIDMFNYIIEFEEEDFIEQIERFEEDTRPASHIYLAALTALNAIQEADGVEYTPLGRALHGVGGTNYFLCTNQECGYVGTRIDPLQDRLILSLDHNEPMPAGVCPHCAGTVRAI